MLLELSVDIELLDAADANIESMPDVAGDVERAFGMLNVTCKSQKNISESHTELSSLCLPSAAFPNIAGEMLHACTVNGFNLVRI